MLSKTHLKFLDPSVPKALYAERLDYWSLFLSCLLVIVFSFAHGWQVFQSAFSHFFHMPVDFESYAAIHSRPLVKYLVQLGIFQEVNSFLAAVSFFLFAVGFSFLFSRPVRYLATASILCFTAINLIDLPVFFRPAFYEAAFAVAFFSFSFLETKGSLQRTLWLSGEAILLLVVSFLSPILGATMLVATVIWKRLETSAGFLKPWRYLAVFLFSGSLFVWLLQRSPAAAFTFFIIYAVFVLLSLILEDLLQGKDSYAAHFMGLFVAFGLVPLAVVTLVTRQVPLASAEVSDSLVAAYQKAPESLLAGHAVYWKDAVVLEDLHPGLKLPMISDKEILEYAKSTEGLQKPLVVGSLGRLFLEKNLSGKLAFFYAIQKAGSTLTGRGLLLEGSLLKTFKGTVPLQKIIFGDQEKDLSSSGYLAYYFGKEKILVVVSPDLAERPFFQNLLKSKKIFRLFVWSS